MIYLASPYSHPDAIIRRTRFLLAEQVTAELMRQGLTIYSPIVHNHELAIKFRLATDFSFWQNYCLGMLRLASEVYVLDIPGWDASRGVTKELDFATECGIMKSFVDPDSCDIYGTSRTVEGYTFG